MGARPELESVECTECGKRYRVYDHIVPSDLGKEEAFPSVCPFCEKGLYAVLANKDGQR